MRPSIRFAAVTLLALGVAAGCQKTPEGNPLVEPVENIAAVDPASQEFNSKISKLMNDLSAKYRPLEYEYDEDLLATLDRVEARLAGRVKVLDPLPLKSLDEAEQLGHFREVIARWSAKTGKTLRKELDPLMAEVAGRKPGGPAFHPEFHRKFSAAFDEIVPIGVAEIRERRNKALHEAAKPLLEEYRAKAPDAVRDAEKTLSEPPFDLGTAAPATSVR